MATVWPTTSPAKVEKRDQLVLNWNSSGIPVTAPIAKLSPKLRRQKRANLSYDSLPARKSIPRHSTRNSASPVVSCGYRVVVQEVPVDSRQRIVLVSTCHQRADKIARRGRIKGA